jgi:hypothetical protein
LWQGGDGDGRHGHADAPTTVDSCDVDETVDAGVDVDEVGVMANSSFGAHRMSLQAGSGPSPTRTSW